jgi:hypothetical protein
VGSILYKAGGFSVPFFTFGSLTILLSVALFFCMPDIQGCCKRIVSILLVNTAGFEVECNETRSVSN